MIGVRTLRGKALFWLPALLVLILVAGMIGPMLAEAQAQTPPSTPAGAQHQSGGEANLKIPDLALVSFGGMSGRVLLQ